jgi:hypothetical protein
MNVATDMHSVRATPLTELEGDTRKRFDWALLIGLDPVLAELVARDESVDLHRVHELLVCSCAPALAVELATPVRG